MKNVKVIIMKAKAPNGNNRTYRSMVSLDCTVADVCEMRNIPMLSILSACSALLTPAGIRSLDDACVDYPQPIVDNGVPLNNPHYPYQGHYTGPEDTKRKPAYHNGTSWAWQMPSLCEAMFLCHGETARKAALSLLASAIYEMNNGCIGFLPEIYDGDAPHLPKGCLAQAWSMTEFYRVWSLLQPV